MNMITSLSGTIEHVSLDSVVLQVNGIGYRVFTLSVVLGTLRVGEKTKLNTYMHVRENEISLYGFVEPRELAFFKLLLQAPGIGPKTALNVMAIATVDTLIRAITGGDVTLLTKVSGIGKKIAERIVVELRTRLEKEHPELTGKGSSVHADVISALSGLGYSPVQAREVARQLPEDIQDTETGIRAALKILGGKGNNR
jgi:Holliday junction DNA helicase RuvA